MTEKRPKLFEDVFYYMSKTLPVEQSKQLARILDLNGGKAASFDDAKLTHYVATSPPGSDSLEPLPEGSSAQLVTPQWIERSLVLSSRQDPQLYSPEPAMLFSGVVATATDLTQTDNEVLCAGISSLGGQWRTAFTKDVTHLFAMNTDSVKYATAMHFRNITGVRIIVPHWFDDVVRMGIKGLPTDAYEFPEPKVFKEYGAQAIRKMTGAAEPDDKDAKKVTPLTPQKKALYDTALVLGSDLPAQRPASANVWDGKKILLSSSLELSKGQREAHEADIVRGGGTVVQCDAPEDEVEKLEEADVFVTRYRSGPAYVKAFRLNKTIGTLPWLWYVRSTGILSRPTDQLLHYPVPRHPIEGFSQHVVTVTNYTGRDREYIKKLILAMGAEFTPSMSGRNNVVVAAYKQGTKTTKAGSWNIPVVHHLWLEDCFIQWRDIPAANEKYIVFPPAVDFGENIGQKGLGEVTYDEEELAALEKEELTPESSLANASARPPLASQPVDESPRRKRGGRESDVGAGDVSAGAYMDIDVPIDDDGRLSDIDIAHDLPGAEDIDDEADMDVEESPSARKSKRLAKKSPVKPKSILKSKAKAKAVESDEEKDEDEVYPGEPPAAQPSTPKRKPVGRVGGWKPFSDDEQEDNVVSVKSTPRKNATPKVSSPKQTRTPRKERVEEDVAGQLEEGPSSTRKLLVKRTYQAKARSRSRSRVRNESESEPEAEAEIPPRRRGRPSNVTPAKKTVAPPARSRSRSRSKSRGGDEDEYEPSTRDPKTPEPPPKRGRGRPRKNSVATPEVAASSHTKATTGRPRGRPRKKPVEVEEREPADDSGSRSRSRGRPTKRRPGEGGEKGSQAADENVEPARVINTRSRSRGRKAVEEDADASPKKAAVTPTKAKITPARPSTKRKKPVLPSDSESDVVVVPAKRVSRGKERAKSIESEDETDGGAVARDGERSRSRSRPLRREVSVVLPTIQQVRSQSRGRSDREEPAKGAKTVQPAPKPEEAPRKRRGRPPKNAPPESPPPERSDSPPVVKVPKRPVVEVPEAGPSNVKIPAKVLPDTPSSAVRTSKRTAASKATEKLHNEIMPDVMNFQKELKSGHVRSAYDREEAATAVKDKDKEHGAKGKKRASFNDEEGESDDERPEKKKAKVLGSATKRKGRKSNADAEVSEEEDADDAGGRTKPHSKTGAAPARNIVVLTTQVNLSEDAIKGFTKLGGKFTQKPTECTHLVAKNFVRTEKFLCGMAIAAHVVNAKWIETSVLQKKILPEEDFPLSDPAGETKFGVKLADVLRRRKANNGKVFEGLTFYVTPKVPVDIKLLRNVVTAGGGQVLAQSPTVRVLKGHDERHIISHQSDVSIWRALANGGFPIYSQELILSSALKQTIDWDSDSNKVPGSF